MKNLGLRNLKVTATKDKNMETLPWLIKGFGFALQPDKLLYALVGSFLGTAVGVLPGLGPTATMALLLTALASLSPVGGLVLLAAVYYGAMYGGSTTSIMVNIPGEAASVITCLDGYPLARQGKAGSALSVAAISSVVAAVLSLVGLVLFAPPLAEVALAFGPPEYLGLTIFSLALIVGLSGKNLRKGFIAAILGLAVSTVGLDPMTAVPRLTFGTTRMLGGIDVVVACVGLFGISEVLLNVRLVGGGEIYARISRLYPTLVELRQTLASMVRSAFIGFFPGLLPGCTATTISFMAYEAERRISKRGHLFGSGVLEGVAAPEGANNAAVSGQFVTLLSLGIPTSPVMAMLLAAMMIYGVQPGPRVFVDHPDVVWTVIASMFVGNVFCVVLNLPLIGLWVKLLSLPYRFLGPMIMVLCLIGAYSVENTMFDVWIMLIFGLLGVAMRKLDYPLAPMVMGMIIGPILERSFRQTLTMLGSLWGIMGRPIALGFLAITLVYLAVVLGVPYLRKRKNREQ